MIANETIEALSKKLEPIFGQKEAQKSARKVLYIAIDDLHEEGKPISQANIEAKILKYTKDFEVISRIHVR